MRLVGLSWLRGLPPALAAVTASAPLGIWELATTIPSTTKSGSAPALIVDTPRRLTWMPPPGAPEFSWMRAPGIFPCNADSSVPVGARVSSSAPTVATALGRFCRSMPVDCPVTTTSSSLKGSGSRATVNRGDGAGGRDGLPLEADGPDRERLVAFRHIHRETTVIPRPDRDAGPLDRHRGLTDPLTGLLVGDLSGQLADLRECRGGHKDAGNQAQAQQARCHGASVFQG